MKNKFSIENEIRRIIIPAIVFILSFLSIFFTHKDILTESNWKTVVLIRSGWIIGSAIWTSLVILHFFDSIKTKILNLLFFLTLSICINLNPLKDLFSGPLILKGKIINFQTEKEFIPSSGYSLGSDMDISIINFLTEDGKKMRFEVNTDFGTKIQKGLANCNSNNIELHYLKNLDGLLKLICISKINYKPPVYFEF